MNSLCRLSSVVGKLGFVGGPRWLRKDLGSRPCAWIWRDFVPPSPFLVIKDPQTQSSPSQILVERHLIDAEFRKTWVPFFCGSGHPVVTVDQCIGLKWHLLPQEPQLDLPRIAGWTGWVGLELRLCLCLGSLRWLFFWSWLRLVEFGLRGSGCLYCHDSQS